MVEGRPQPINITSGTDLALARNCLLWRHVTGRPEWMAGIARKTPGSNPGRPPRYSRCGEWVKNPNSNPGRAATGAPHTVCLVWADRRSFSQFCLVSGQWRASCLDGRANNEFCKIDL